MSLHAGTVVERPVLPVHSDENYYFARSTIIASSKLNYCVRVGAKAFCVPIVFLLVIAALGPEKWAPRTHFGWQFDHFIGYFGITLFVCVGWPRPFVVGGVFAAVAALLEGLQAFTPDRSAYLPAIVYGAAGVLVAALIFDRPYNRIRGGRCGGSAGGLGDPGGRDRHLAGRQQGCGKGSLAQVCGAVS